MDHLQILHRGGALTDLDLCLGWFVRRQQPAGDPLVALTAAFASRAAGEGNVCLDLARSAGQPMSADFPDSPCWPELAVWEQSLRRSPLVGGPGDWRPLVLDAGHRLYLQRFHHHETTLARRLLGLAREEVPIGDEARLGRSLAGLFPPGGDGAPDWQAVAALSAVTKRLCIISGAPGTGKTTTMAKILVLLQALQPEDHPLRIRLCAPTGKAAARMAESMQAVGPLGPADVGHGAMAWPREASTIHRLLGWQPGGRFRHDRNHPLGADVVVLDEASMVDLALMNRLVAALAPQARLIVLGDKDQLASVDAGAVMGDLCDRRQEGLYSETFRRRCARLLHRKLDAPAAGCHSATTLADTVTVLQKNYRFGAASPIGRFSRAVNHGDAGTARQILAEGRDELVWLTPDGAAPSRDMLRDLARRGYEGYLRSPGPLEALERFSRFRILCAVKAGPLGVEEINRLAEEALAAAGLIDAGDTWYAGRPVLVTRNDYRLGLFNGDTGVVWPRPGIAAPAVCFRDARGNAHWVDCRRLPAVVTAYALTVHRSQGSEVAELVLLLPDRDSPVLTRELLYTGVTRARERVHLWAPAAILERTIRARLERRSGLRESLWRVPEAGGEGL
jgi:exodeoxyribonuclease V alpha subunit